MEASCGKNWKFVQCFGDKNESASVNEVDIITALEFNHNGEYLASGDKGGRVVIFKRNDSSLQCDYQFCTEIQSHECEFDYLKSIVIDEKINKLKWCKPQNNTQYLLSTNGTLFFSLTVEKSIKLWKITEKTSKAVIENNSSLLSNALSSSSFLTPLIPKLPKVQEQESIIHSSLKHAFSPAHMYHINSISTCADGELFLSSDDLRINIWNLNAPSAAFNVLDLKPSSFENISEVITTSEFHPLDPNAFIYGTSKGVVNLIDMRRKAIAEQPSCSFTNKYSQKNIFTDLIENITSAKFSQDGRFIVCRDFMNITIWDTNMPSEPIRRLPVHEYLMPKLSDLFDNDCIYDKFDFCMNSTASQVMAGSYGNNFFIYDTINSTVQTFEANRTALKRIQVKGEIISNPFVFTKQNQGKSHGFEQSSNIGKNACFGQSTDTAKNIGSSAKTGGFPTLETFNTDRKVMYSSWHPTENTLAVGATNMLYIFSQVNAMNRSANE